MLERILYIPVGIFLLVYGLKAFIAGIKKEDKAYFMTDGCDGMESVFKNKYPIYQNIVGGSLCILSGTGIITVYSI
ncbi:hypothetical protein ACTJIJ_19355 [Niabella sp. 22666]|uniref:hypothetical protein n=1 Tax=Niabella sp. 22666 TaxID=3453954 RepID=UPI003F87C123